MDNFLWFCSKGMQINQSKKIYYEQYQLREEGGVGDAHYKYYNDTNRKSTIRHTKS